MEHTSWHLDQGLCFPILFPSEVIPMPVSRPFLHSAQDSRFLIPKEISLLRSLFAISRFTHRAFVCTHVCPSSIIKGRWSSHFLAPWRGMASRNTANSESVQVTELSLFLRVVSHVSLSHLSILNTTRHPISSCQVRHPHPRGGNWASVTLRGTPLAPKSGR